MKFYNVTAEILTEIMLQCNGNHNGNYIIITLDPSQKDSGPCQVPLQCACRKQVI